MVSSGCGAIDCSAKANSSGVSLFFDPAAATFDAAKRFATVFTDAPLPALFLPDPFFPVPLDFVLVVPSGKVAAGLSLAAADADAAAAAIANSFVVSEDLSLFMSRACMAVLRPSLLEVAVEV